VYVALAVVVDVFLVVLVAAVVDEAVLEKKR